MGCAVTYLPVDGARLVDPEDVRRALRPETRLITIIMANNETGVLQPVEEMAQDRRGSGCVLPYGRGAGGGQDSDRREADSDVTC